MSRVEVLYKGWIQGYGIASRLLSAILMLSETTKISAVGQITMLKIEIEIR